MRSLGLVDATIVGSGEPVGGLVGQMGGGWVTRCYSTGEVTGASRVGGLVGQNGASFYCGMTPVVEAGFIDQCWSTASVSGSGWSIGGLVGTNWSYGDIEHCYTLGSVGGDGAVGGLVGRNTAGRIPGLASLIIASIGEGPIVNCYSAASVCGNVDVGGLVGCHSAGEITNCFWDIEMSDLGNMCGSDDDIAGDCDDSYGRITAEMQTASTFLEAGWDFIDETENGTDDIWKIVEGRTYPLLSWQKYGGGTGEPNDPYLIYTAEHLNALGAEPNDYDKHFKLMADIDLSGYVYDRAVIAPDTNDDYAYVFGQDYYNGFNGIYFTGTFDGNNQTISHLTISGVSYLGLFGRIWQGAIVSNLRLETLDVCGTGEYVGGLIGSSGGTVTNCHTSGVVRGVSSVGGLVGGNSSSITACYSTGTVTGEHDVGGLVGTNCRGTITAGHSTVSVSGVYHVGGLVGTNGGVYVDDSAHGYWTEALVGGTIEGCYATGKTVGGWAIGGLVGSNHGEVTESLSTSSVSGSDGIGGLVGGGSGTIDRCYCSGNVTGEVDVGGLAGWVWDSLAWGSFGFSGTHYYGAKLFDCYSTGLVTGVDSAGDLSVRTQT